MDNNNYNKKTEIIVNTALTTSSVEKVTFNKENIEMGNPITPRPNICVFCGEDLENEHTSLEHHSFKKMCVNCQHCEMVTDGYVCQNEENKNTVLTKMKDAASAITEAYKLVNIEISPLPLKKPKGKCKYWSLSEEVKQRMESLFN
jgi:L-asparaginase II